MTKKMLLGFAVLLSFLNVGQAQEETYNFRNFMQVYICPPNTSADDCEVAPNSRVPIDFSIVLKDQNTQDPKTFLGTASTAVVRDSNTFHVEVTVVKFVYSNVVGYELRSVVTNENDSIRRKVILNLNSMADFKARIDNFSDSYKRGTTLYTPVFMTMPADWTLRDQFRIPILADIMASE